MMSCSNGDFKQILSKSNPIGDIAFFGDNICFYCYINNCQILTKEVKGYHLRVSMFWGGFFFFFSFLFFQDSNGIRPRYHIVMKGIYTILLRANICLMVPSYNVIYKIINILLMFIIK